MKPLLITILLAIFIATPSLAQEDTIVCAAPFFTETQATETVISVDEAQFTDDLFQSRILFEHAYNAIKFEIRITQLNAMSEETGTDVGIFLAQDPLVEQVNTENDNPALLANRVLGEFAADAIVWRYAADNDITVTAALLDATIADFFDVEEGSEEYDALVGDFINRLLSNGANMGDIELFFCRQAMYELVQQAVIGDSDTTLYVNVDHILVSSQEVAQDIINLITAGDDFAILANELSLDVATGQNGGALGWQPVIFYVLEFADAVTNGELNTILAPVETQFGWHVIRINAREERLIEDDRRDLIISSQFSRWRSEQIANATISVNPDWQSFIPQL